MTAPSPVREERKAETRRSIQEHALRLFLERGYDATTVEDIAAAAGVSHITFFRHFPRKEAVVEYDDYDPMIVQLIAARPADEAPLTAIRRALLRGLSAIPPADRNALLVRSRLTLSTPALRARGWKSQQATRALFAQALAARAGEAEPSRASQALAAAALAVVTSAIEIWVAGDGTEELSDLVDEAFEVLDRSVPPV